MTCEQNICHPGGLVLTDKLLEWLEEWGADGEKPMTLLDIGCGSGDVLRYIHGVRPGWTLMGIDPEANPATDHAGIELIQGCGEALPIPDQSVDIILMECSFSRVGDADRTLSECHRVLRKEGALVVSDLYRRAEVDPPEVRNSSDLLRENGSESRLAIGRLETAGEIRERFLRAGFHPVRMKDHSGSLEQWIGQRIFDCGISGTEKALGVELRSLKKARTGYYLGFFVPSTLKELIRYASEHAVAYRPLTLTDTEDETEILQSLPFCSAEDLRKDPYRYLCVSPREVARIITLKSSGSEGAPKRIFFTGEDLERTARFFSWGIRSLVRPGDHAAVFMESELHYSVGGLLKEGLASLPAEVSVYGFIRDYREAAELARGKDSIIGVPSQIYRLAKTARDLRPKTVLLSADQVSDSLKDEIERLWGCRVFEHWGMSETGYGGAVQCSSREGCHLREEDLMLEVIDPCTGQVLPEGSEGELVITTLHREAMPLIRYRTGDRGRLLPEPCACGSLLPRLARVSGRIRGQESFPDGRCFSLPELDEIMYRLDILAYTAGWDRGEKTLSVHMLAEQEEDEERLIQQAAGKIRSQFGESFVLRVDAKWNTEGRGKRRLVLEPGE